MDERWTRGFDDRVMPASVDPASLDAGRTKRAAEQTTSRAIQTLGVAVVISVSDNK